MEHSVANVLVELGAVLVGLSLAARIARVIGLSPIPLYLLIGLGVGNGGLVEIRASEEFIRVGAEIGVVLLLFFLGLEYSASELLGNLRRSAVSGLLDAALNFAPGFVAGFLLGWSPLAAALLGGVTYISSSGVIAKLLADLGRVGNRETPVILTLLVIEDLAMAVFLPIVAALLVGETATGAAVNVVVALSAVTAVLIVTLRAGDRLSRVLLSRSSEVMLLGILGVTLLVAGIAERVQLSAAVGAFLVGIAVSGEAASQARDLLLPMRNLFAAVFFLFFGLGVDPASLPDVAVPVVVLAVVTAATKILTGWMAAAREGIGRRGRVRAGTTLVARGEFSIVIAALGAGIEPDLGPLAAGYVILLAVSSAFLARLGEGRPESRRSVASAAPSL